MDLILEQLGSTFSEDLLRSIILRRLAFKEWIMRVKSKKPCSVGICHQRCNKVLKICLQRWRNVAPSLCVANYRGRKYAHAVDVKASPGIECSFSMKKI